MIESTLLTDLSSCGFVVTSRGSTGPVSSFAVQYRGAYCLMNVSMNKHVLTTGVKDLSGGDVLDEFHDLLEGCCKKLGLSVFAMRLEDVREMAYYASRKYVPYEQSADCYVKK